MVGGGKGLQRGFAPGGGGIAHGVQRGEDGGSQSLPRGGEGGIPTLAGVRASPEQLLQNAVAGARLARGLQAHAGPVR